METLGGLPVERFVGRRIKAQIPDQGFCVVKCVEALWGKLVVEIKVKGSKRLYPVTLTNCNPNWTENTDLKEEAESIIASPDALQGLKDELDARMAPTVPKPPPEPSRVAPAAKYEPFSAAPDPTPVITPYSGPLLPSSPVPSVPAKPSSAGGTRLDIDHDFDPTWIDDYRELQKTLQENDEITLQQAELKNRLLANTEMVQLCLAEMARKGVRIVPGDSAPIVTAIAPHPAPVAPAPTRPFHISAPCVDATPRIVKKPDGRSNAATPEEMERRKHAIHRVLTTLRKGEEVNIKEVLEHAMVPFFSSTRAMVIAVADSTPGIKQWLNGKKITFTREG